MANCSVIPCDTGALGLEQILLRLFAVDENGCVGIKLMWLWGDDCEGYEEVDVCGSVMTLEQVIKQAIVDDGCGGWALASFFVASPQDEQ